MLGSTKLQPLLIVFSGASATKFIVAAGQFLFFALLSRVLDTEEFAEFAVLYSLMIGASILGRFGFDRSLIPAVAVAYEARRRDEINKTLVLVLKRTTLLSITSYSSLASLYFLFSPKQLYELPIVAHLAVCASSILYSALFVLGAALKGMGRAALATAVEGGLPAVFTSLLLGAGLAAGMTIQLTGVILVHLASISFTHLLAMRASGLKLSAESSTSVLILRGNYDFLLVNLAGYLLLHMPVLMLGVWGDAESLKKFKLAERLVQAVGMTGVAVNNVMASQFALSNRLRGLDHLKTLYYRSILLSVLAGLPIIAAIILWGQQVVNYFAVPQVQIGSLISIMALGQFVSVSLGGVGTLLATTGNHRALRRNMVIVSGIGVPCYLIASYGWQEYGAALTYTLLISIQNIANAMIVWTYFKNALESDKHA